jgi:FKBP-type peptidyl-prolyl cis-trans isomerase
LKLVKRFCSVSEVGLIRFACHSNAFTFKSLISSQGRIHPLASLVLTLGLGLACGEDPGTVAPPDSSAQKSSVISTETKPATKPATKAAPLPAAKAEPKAIGIAPGVYATFYTSKGMITALLEFEKAPLTVSNFVGLAEGTKSSNKPNGTRFFDGLTFHRVVPTFVIQGGDPLGNGTGGPGYKFPDEFDPTLRHDKEGILSMANSGPGTNGSQFFITMSPTPHLNDKHSIFGHVIDGYAIVPKIAQGDKMDSVRITRIGPKAKAFKVTEEQFQYLITHLDSAKAAKEAAIKAEQEAQAQKAKADMDALEKNAKVTPSGLKFVITKPGSGAKPQRGNKAVVHYVGKLQDGTKFDSSVDQNRPIEVPVGVGMVIPGWDEALLDMQKGEKRTLVIPPNLAYGTRANGKIPANSTLIFEVELLDFKVTP